MKNLITPAEVIELAFSPHDQVEPSIITGARIGTAQLRFLRSPLGNLYSALSDEKYEEFVKNWIKPALAHFAKYNVLLHLSVCIGNEGIIRNQPLSGEAADYTEIARLRKEARRTAKSLLRETLEYIRANPEKFPEYKPEECVRRKKEIREGGIVL